MTDLATMLARLRTLNDQIAELTADADAIKAQLRRQLGVGEHMVDGRKAVTITPQRRFSAERATQVLTPEMLALCTRQVVDSKLARSALPGSVYEMCRVESGEPVVRLA